MEANNPLVLYTKLRKAVATDVKAARRDFCALLVEPEEFMDGVLDLASQPGEGRVRQMVATAARLERFVNRIEPWLVRWLVIEADEFARSAIVAALQTKSPEPAAEPQSEEMPIGFIETYRFVADRLCHRVQQTLPISSTMLVRLERLAQKIPDESSRAELTEVLGKLRSAFHRLSHTLEFDVGDGYLDWQPIALGDWLDTAKSGFTSRLGQAKLTVIGSPQARSAKIRANHFLLETAFGNLWVNAVQATAHIPQTECHITAEFNLSQKGQKGEKSLDVLLRDNGPGFTAAFVDTAFRMPYSTKGESRGRGLLEIADAIRRLQGKVKLVPVGANEYRVLVSFDWQQL